MDHFVYLFCALWKGFRNVPQEELINLLNNLGMDEHDVRLLKSQDWQQKQTSKQLDIRRGDRQPDILSPILFNLFSENMFYMALKSETYEIKINGSH